MGREGGGAAVEDPSDWRSRRGARARPRNGFDGSENGFDTRNNGFVRANNGFAGPRRPCVLFKIGGFVGLLGVSVAERRLCRPGQGCRGRLWRVRSRFVEASFRLRSRFDWVRKRGPCQCFVGVDGFVSAFPCYSAAKSVKRRRLAQDSGWR